MYGYKFVYSVMAVVTKLARGSIAGWGDTTHCELLHTTVEGVPFQRPKRK